MFTILVIKTSEKSKKIMTLLKMKIRGQPREIQAQDHFWLRTTSGSALSHQTLF